MNAPAQPRASRVGALRPNQLLHSYGVGAVADLPNLSVVTMGLDRWDLRHSEEVTEERLLAAVRGRLGVQVEALRRPPYLPETNDLFGDWTRVGVPVGLFPTWLRCSDTRCNRLGRADGGFFELIHDVFNPDRVRYVHSCRGGRTTRPVAVPARFVLACGNGHLDDFPWLYFAHDGFTPESGHSLQLIERGTTGEAANIIVRCECGNERSMAQALGTAGAERLPACRGRHPHLGTFGECGLSTRTLVLGATNSWFAMQLRAFSLPRSSDPVDQLVGEYWGLLGLLAALPAATAKTLMRTQRCWPELEPYGEDKVWEAIRRRASGPVEEEPVNASDLLTPEWETFTDNREYGLPDFSTRVTDPPQDTEHWLDKVVLVTRLREVSALYGFTRIDAPEWGPSGSADPRCAPLAEGRPTWVPCAETRGEGIFFQFSHRALAEWAQREAVCDRERRILIPAHEQWRERRRLDPGNWPGSRYVLLHTFAHAMIRELALESGYSASGIGERIYVDPENPAMAGILLYTAAPDSEGTLGGLVALGEQNSLGSLINRALDAARLCSSDPLCAEHDPGEHARLYGAACHACLFASETSCERGNQYLDRTLLVDTLASAGCGFFGS
ncbi:DrmB family protein [Actinosynnema sp. NPDC059335]|uniref:DrmB family protein n=1 Tax=Actinosynnema sp. NPDC059335 TaxID=3346804 RepID=UPI00366B3BD3